MRNKILLLLGIMLPLYLQAYSQMLYPIVGTYKGKSAQGMAIWKDRAYLFSDGGHCRVIDLNTGLKTCEFDLASSNKKPHINNACFGIEVEDSMSEPVIYISETNNPHRCYVESLNGNKPVLVQTIDAKINGKVVGNNNWIVDREKGELYGIDRKWGQFLDDQGNVKNIITRYRLPKLSEGEYITLTEKDVIDKFEIVFANGMQDAKIRKGILYIVAGLDELSTAKKDSNRSLIIVDLKKKRIIKKMDLTYVTTNEPEGVDFWKKKCIMYCGQTGGLFKIPSK